MVYQYKSWSNFPVSAQVAGEVCEKLDSEGRLTPHDLVDESRNEDAPLHQVFEWNDDIAAERYREVQAGRLIRCITVVPEKAKTEQVTRAFVSIKSDDAEGDSSFKYRSIDRVLKSANDRSVMLADAKRDLIAFKNKYQVLYELASVFDAIDGFVGSQQALELAG